jgi:hypothetical protein
VFCGMRIYSVLSGAEGDLGILARSLVKFTMLHSGPIRFSPFATIGCGSSCL